MLQLPHGAKALIRMTPLELPQPVTRSYPFSVEYVPLLPLVKNQKARPALQPRRALVLCSPKPIPASIHEYETQANSWVAKVHQVIVVADQYDVNIVVV